MKTELTAPFFFLFFFVPLLQDLFISVHGAERHLLYIQAENVTFVEQGREYGITIPRVPGETLKGMTPIVGDYNLVTTARTKKTKRIEEEEGEKREEKMG